MPVREKKARSVVLMRESVIYPLRKNAKFELIDYC